MTLFERAQNLTEFEKWKIYCLYLAKYFSLKHALIISIFHINDLSSYNKRTYSYSKYEVGWNTRLYDLTRDVCKSFTDFISPDNIITIDKGDDWQKQGFAQRTWIDYPSDSLAYWFIRHKEFGC